MYEFLRDQFEVLEFRSSNTYGLMEVYSNLGAVQLTEGCSIGCAFCGFNAPKGVKQVMSPSRVVEVLYNARRTLRANHTFFYWASDPFDFEGYPGLHKFVTENFGYAPFVSTAVPKGKEQVVIDNIDLVNRVSLTYWNKGRLKKRWDCDQWSKVRGRILDIDQQINFSLSAGTSEKEDVGARPIEGIGCFDGSLITPSGGYSVLQLGKNDSYQEFQVTVKIDRDKFETSRFPKTAIELKKFAENAGKVPLEALLEISVPRYRFAPRDFTRAGGRAALFGNGRIVELVNPTGHFFIRIDGQGVEVEVLGF